MPEGSSDPTPATRVLLRGPGIVLRDEAGDARAYQRHGLAVERTVACERVAPTRAIVAPSFNWLSLGGLTLWTPSTQ
jgi:hypothetical protein